MFFYLIIRSRLSCALAVLLFTGCASFTPLRLDAGRTPLHVADIKVSASAMPTADLRHYPFDPTNGLDTTEVAMLAIANNPQLRVERDQAGVAHAEAYAAGLLPDPSVSYEHDKPVGNAPGATDSFTAALAFDLGNLVTRSARVAAARAGEREVDLNLLWGEWQTIAQARTLFDRVYYTRKLVARLRQEQAALAPMQVAIARALDSGELTYAVAGTGLNAAAQVNGQLAAAERQLHQDQHDLHGLLGLGASTPVHLAGAPFSTDPDQRQVAYALAHMASQRPDLLALKAGYDAQQEKVRAAVLAQFPAITVGLVRARDNSNISSAGFTIGLSLPLFDGNRGHIAVARATRQQLRDAYAARLLTSRNDVRRLYADLQIDRAQQKTLTLHAAQLARARRAAQSNYAAGRLDWPTYLAMRESSLASDTALLTLAENTHATAIALDALAGHWPDASLAVSSARKEPRAQPENRP
ncbi:MAG: TolC family protein [Rhodanobacteraceae bacterium]|nr:MAG: TolC family protein [Rhodanobacteraceae bacterium]